MDDSRSVSSPCARIRAALIAPRAVRTAQCVPRLTPQFNAAYACGMTSLTCAASRIAPFVVALAMSPLSTLHSQAVSVDAGPIRPYPSEASQRKGGRDQSTPSSAVALYATASLGPAGAVDGVALDARGGMHFATVHLMFSAAALPNPGEAEFRVVGNLRRLNAQVLLTPLDSAQQPIDDPAALQLLGTLPDTMLAAAARASGDSGSSSAGTAALSVVTRTLMPELQAGAAVGKRVGSAIVSFAGLYHRPTARLQVGYINDMRAFGWMWYAHEQDVIEGTHRASAVLEVAARVRYVRVQIRLVGEWQSHGSWQRDVGVVLNLNSGT